VLGAENLEGVEGAEALAVAVPAAGCRDATAPAGERPVAAMAATTSANPTRDRALVLSPFAPFLAVISFVLSAVAANRPVEPSPPILRSP
jgi:hypothetical protein